MGRCCLTVAIGLAMLTRPALAQTATVTKAVPPSVAAPARDQRVPSLLGVVGVYAALGTWMWFAWYADQPKHARLRYGGDGWFGSATYAGGADKLGHVWTNLTLSRLGTEVLRSGGWGAWSSSLLASGIGMAALALVEVNDGFYTELSPGDLVGNTVGAALGVTMSHWPALDDAIDFRAQWFPSRAFLGDPGPNLAEDYSGQTYLLAFKPRSIAAVRVGESSVAWLQFVNPVLAFESRNYKPTPRAQDLARRQQRVFLGVTLDMQAVLDAILSQNPATRAQRVQRIGHALFEVLNPPLSTFPVLTMSRSPD